MTFPSKKYLGEKSQYGANCLVHQLDYRHWVWCILNGYGNRETERVDSGDRDAEYSPQTYCIPSKDKMPGIEIAPYKGPISSGWGPLAEGEGEELLRILYATMRILFPSQYINEMESLQGWSRKAWRLFVDIASYGNKMDEEFKLLDKIPVPLGRDGIIAAFRYHVMGEPYYYIEGVSRTVTGSISKEFLLEMINHSDLEKLMLIDTGFAGSIPRRLLGILGVDSNNKTIKPSLEIPAAIKAKHPEIDQLLQGVFISKKGSLPLDEYFYLLSSQNNNPGHYCYSTTSFNSYKQNNYDRLKYMYEGDHDAYRSTIVNMEYTAKFYLRPVEVIEGYPKLQPSGDAIKAALMNLAIFSYLKKAYPDREISLYHSNPLLHKTVKKKPETIVISENESTSIPEIKDVLQKIKIPAQKVSVKAPPFALAYGTMQSYPSAYVGYQKLMAQLEEEKKKAEQATVTVQKTAEETDDVFVNISNSSVKMDELFHSLMEGLINNG